MLCPLFCPEVRTRFEGWIDSPDAVTALTARELEVARLTAQGLPFKKIAEVLKTSEQAAKNVASRARRKLGLENKLALALWYISRNGTAAADAKQP